MLNLELIFSMLGEKVATEVTRKNNSQGFDECLDSAKEGGDVAVMQEKILKKELAEVLFQIKILKIQEI